MAAMIQRHKIAMLGEGGVGKTSLTIALERQQFTETYDPTLEDSHWRQCVVDGQATKLEILDTAGQEEYEALRDQWIRDNELFTIVYDITRRSSFTAVERLYEKVINIKTSLDPSFSPKLIILVGNKADLMDRKEINTFEGKALAQKLGCSFIETSAKTHTNVEEAFFTLVRADRKHRQAAYSSEAQQHMDDMAALGIKPSRSSKMKFLKKFSFLERKHSA